MVKKLDESKLRRFDEFWKIYPRRESKLDAKKAWIQTDADNIAEEILVAIDRQKRYSFKDRRFTPLPATWLRAGKWEDELPAPAVAVPSHSHGPVPKGPPPQTCPHRAYLNDQLLNLLLRKLQARITVSNDVLRQCVQYRNHVAGQWESMWPDKIDYPERLAQTKIAVKTFEDLIGAGARD